MIADPPWYSLSACAGGSYHRKAPHEEMIETTEITTLRSNDDTSCAAVARRGRIAVVESRTASETDDKKKKVAWHTGGRWNRPEKSSD